MAESGTRLGLASLPSFGAETVSHWSWDRLSGFLVGSTVCSGVGCGLKVAAVGLPRAQHKSQAETARPTQCSVVAAAGHPPPCSGTLLGTSSVIVTRNIVS